MKHDGLRVVELIPCHLNSLMVACQATLGVSATTSRVPVCRPRQSG